MFGSVAYLGSLSLKSALMTAGNFTFIVSKPPSISLVTCSSPFCFSIWSQHTEAYMTVTKIHKTSNMQTDSLTPKLYPCLWINES